MLVQSTVGKRGLVVLTEPYPMSPRQEDQGKKESWGHYCEPICLSVGLKQLCLISHFFLSINNILSFFIKDTFIKSNFVISSVPGINARQAPKEIKDRILVVLIL